MGYVNINNLWKEEFNKRSLDYQIDEVLLNDACSCVYVLKDNRELRITVNTHMYHFSKIMKVKQYKHVAKIYDCFKMVLPNQYGEDEYVYCIVSERICRDFQSRSLIQSAIKLFRDTWTEYIKSIGKLELNSDVCIEQAYANSDSLVKKYVLQQLKKNATNSIVFDIVIALHDTYQKVKKLDAASVIYLFPENIGLSDDGVVKICNISHDFIGLDDCYEIDVAKDSITITYNPIGYDFIVDKRMLVPLKICTGETVYSVLGLIDTGAECSCFAESLYKRFSLGCLGETKVVGVTGVKETVRTACVVEFPNGFRLELKGLVIDDDRDVSIIIGMDLIMSCKLLTEPYENGFRYKLIFRNLI